MTPNQIAEAARKKAAEDGPEAAERMRAVWTALLGLIDAKWEVSNSPDRKYHREQDARKSRLAMLTAYLEGKSPEECFSEAAGVVKFQ